MNYLKVCYYTDTNGDYEDTFAEKELQLYLTKDESINDISLIAHNVAINQKINKEWYNNIVCFETDGIRIEDGGTICKIMLKVNEYMQLLYSYEYAN